MATAMSTRMLLSCLMCVVISSSGLRLSFQALLPTPDLTEQTGALRLLGREETRMEPRPTRYYTEGVPTQTGVANVWGREGQKSKTQEGSGKGV